MSEKEIIKQLKLINQRLETLESDIKEIKKDANNMAKYVPFVDSLSKIGTLGTIANLTEFLGYFNPTKLLRQDPIRKDAILDSEVLGPFGNRDVDDDDL